MANGKELEKRVQQLELWFKVAFALAAILGLSGLGLWRSLVGAQNSVDTLSSRVAELERTASTVDKTIQTALARVREAEEKHIRDVGEQERSRLLSAGVDLQGRLTKTEERLTTLERASVKDGDTVFLGTWRTGNYLTAPDGGSVQNGVVRSNSPNKGQDERLTVLKAGS